MWALIRASTVIELTAVDPTGRFDNSMTWAACPSTVQQGWAASETGGAWAFSAPAAPPAPTLAQQAAAMIAGGMQLLSTGTPALNGTYPVDPASYQKIMGIVAAIGGGLGLPGGGSTFNWLDISGMPHAFTATAFTAFAKAVMGFLYTLDTIAGSDSGTLPAQPETIA